MDIKPDRAEPAETGQRGGGGREARVVREARALRENLLRRKAQGRAQSEADETGTPGEKSR